MQNVVWERETHRESRKDVKGICFVEFVALMPLATRLIVMKDRCKIACLLCKHLFRFSFLLPCPAEFKVLYNASGLYSLA